MKYKLLSHIIDNSTPSYANRDKVIVAPIMIEDGNGGNVTVFAKEFFV